MRSEGKNTDAEREKGEDRYEWNNKQEKQIRSEVKAFYLDARGGKIGIIEEQEIFDLFYEHTFPIIYNKALDDAQYWRLQQVENLQSDHNLLYCDIDRRELCIENFRR